MNMLNSIILEGVVEGEVTSTMSCGLTMATMPISVKRKYRDKNGNECGETSYFDVEMYGNLAVSVSKNAEKGKGVRVIGRLKQKRWEENGKLQSKIVVIAEHVEYKVCFDEKEEAKNGD